MRKVKYYKFILMFVLLFMVIGFITVLSKDLVSYYDTLLENDKFILYSNEQITDDVSFKQVMDGIVSKYRNQEYYNSYNDYGYLNLLVQSCNYEDMICNFKLQREKYDTNGFSTEVVKEYSNIDIDVNNDLESYFSMVNDNKVTINYDENMFTSDSAKIEYIRSYIDDMAQYNNGISIRYEYNSSTKTITRTESLDLTVIKVMMMKVDDVVFEYTEETYSDIFKKLTTGTLTIKSNVEITKSLLSEYLTNFYFNNNSFSVDGEIVNGKVFIVRKTFVDNKSVVAEKHLVTLVQDSNISIDRYENVGLKDGVQIKAVKPEKNVSSYLSSFFNNFQPYYELDDGGEERFSNFYSFNEEDYAVIKYIRYDKNYNVVEIQYNRIPIIFIGYSDAVSDEYFERVGDEIVIRADKLDDNSISTNLDYSLTALGCNDDYSYCDILWNDHNNNRIEIHNIKMVLDNTISNEFKSAFNLKDDDSIDIIAGEKVEIMFFSPILYDDKTNNSLQYNCSGFNMNGYDKVCQLTLKNYEQGKSETHSILYNVIQGGATPGFQTAVNLYVDVYPGESTSFWGNLRNSYELFSNNIDSSKVRIEQCDPIAKTCPVVIINSRNILEIQNVSVNLLEGRSPEFNEQIKGDTVKLNSIYKDDINFLYRASMGYLMSKTKSWSYMDQFENGKAKVVFNNIETHTLNVQFEEANEKHQKTIDKLVEQIGDEEIVVEIDDLEFVNKFYYNDDIYALNSNNYNSRILTDELGKRFNNKHISYFFAIEGGVTGLFGQEFGGQLVLYYDGVAYSMTNSIIRTIFKNIVYVPDNTADTKEAFIAAAQKRIDKYLGKNSGVVVSYSRELRENELEDDYLFENENISGSVYRISHKNKSVEFLIIKDSSKMKNSTFKAVDVNNNVSISSDNANYPTDTVVSSDKKVDEKEYKKLLKKLGLDTAEVIDINLYSPNIGEIDEFNNVSFDVNVPIDTDKFDINNLYAYYIDDDGRVEEHPVVVDEFMATFNTTHFSTYIIAERVDSDIINPETSDGIIGYILLGVFSIVTLVFGTYYLKKKNIN